MVDSAAEVEPMTNEQYLTRRSAALGQGDTVEVRRLDAEASAPGGPLAGTGKSGPVVPQPIVAPAVPEPRAKVPTGGPVVSYPGTAETVGANGPVAPGVSRAHVPTPWAASPGYPKNTPDGVVLDWGPNGPPVPLPVPDTRIPPPVTDERATGLTPTLTQEQLAQERLKPHGPYPPTPLPKP